MNIGAQILNHMSAGQNSLFGNGLMKSTAQRLERQAERDKQVSFIENQKRKKEAVEEALGIDEEKGMLSEILEEMSEEVLNQSLEDIPEMESETPLDQEPAQATEFPAQRQFPASRTLVFQTFGYPHTRTHL